MLNPIHPAGTSFARLGRGTARSPIRWEALGDPSWHSRGAEVVDCLLRSHEQHEFHKGGGKRMTILIEALDGRPILHVSTDGLHPYMDLLQEFQRIGLRDRLMGEGTGISTADAIFR